MNTAIKKTKTQKGNITYINTKALRRRADYKRRLKKQRIFGGISFGISSVIYLLSIIFPLPAAESFNGFLILILPISLYLIFGKRIVTLL